MGRDTEAPTVDQLRKRIDRGQTGDKAPGVDPAAAPLGTDDEAAGHPPTEEERTMAAEAQPASDPRRPSGGGDATESLRAAEDRAGEGEAPDPRRDGAARPSDGGGASESARAGDVSTEDRDARREEQAPAGQPSAAP